MGRIWVLSRTGLLVVLVCSVPMLFSVAYPVVATNDDPDVAQSAPRDCVAPPSQVVASESDATVTATAARGDDGTVNITYDIDPETDTGTDLTIPQTAGFEFVETHGFDREQLGSLGSWQTGASSALRVNRSAESHWLTYRTAPAGESQRDPYPTAEDWVIAPIPDHTDERVFLEPAASGYVGDSTLYLGSFERESTTVGCQTFDVVVPAEAGSIDTDERLADLESAARTIPGRKYETVSVFVSPADLGTANRVGGFVRGETNEIVVAEDASALPTAAVWIHEYVHTLQDYRSQSDLEWTVEGVATYAALETAVDTGRITPLEYDIALSRLNRAHEGGGSLTNASSELTPYARGTVVLARIDADLEAHSETTIYDLVAWLNDHPEPGYDDLKAYLEDEAGLPRERVASYDRLVYEDDPVAVEYRHAPTELSPTAWTAVSLLLTDAFRAFSGVWIAGVSAMLVVSGCYARLRVDPDEIDF